MKKKVLFWVIVLTVVTVALVTVISTQVALQKEKERLRELEAVRDQLLLENERLAHDLNEDITDAYIVRLVRKLGYYFPGEKQVTFTDPQTTEEHHDSE